MTTKDKIISTAVELFNQRGYAHVTMRDIAAGKEMSPGNLAYHFKNKDALLEEVYARLSAELADRVAGIRLIPSFENIDFEIAPFLEFQRKYRFFYLDILDICRVFPKIALEHRVQTDQQISAIRAVIAYSVEKGNMFPERIRGVYDQLARTVWMIYSFWLTQSLLLAPEAKSEASVKGKRNKAAAGSTPVSRIPVRSYVLAPAEESGDEQARRAIWTLVLPYLTPKGKTHFEPVAQRHHLIETNPS